MGTAQLSPGSTEKREPSDNSAPCAKRTLWHRIDPAHGTRDDSQSEERLPIGSALHWSCGPTASAAARVDFGTRYAFGLATEQSASRQRRQQDILKTQTQNALTFEETIRRWLLANHRRCKDLEPFVARLMQCHQMASQKLVPLDQVRDAPAGQPGQQADVHMETCLFISLADRTDVARLLVALAWLMSDHTPIVLIDANGSDRCLSRLCEVDSACGWMEVQRGWLAASESMVALAMPQAYLIPAGSPYPRPHVGTSHPQAERNHARPERTAAKGHIGQQLVARFGRPVHVWLDGGTWPDCVPDLSWQIASRVFVVVRLNQTRWSHLEECQRALAASGHHLDGYVVFGDA